MAEVEIFSSTCCRICLEETNTSRLYKPCSCKGSMAYAHPNCVRRWIYSLHKQKKRLGTTNIKEKTNKELVKCNSCLHPLSLSPDMSPIMMAYKNSGILATLILLLVVWAAGYVFEYVDVKIKSNNDVITLNSIQEMASSISTSMSVPTSSETFNSTSYFDLNWKQLNDGCVLLILAISILPGPIMKSLLFLICASYILTGELSPNNFVNKGTSCTVEVVQSVETALQASLGLFENANDFQYTNTAQFICQAIFSIIRTWVKSAFLTVKYYYAVTLFWSMASLYVIIKREVHDKLEEYL